MSKVINNRKKIWRYLSIYGIGKTAFKILGRLRLKRIRLPAKRIRDIGVIGCGQYAYSTLGYAIWHKFGNRFISCYDISSEKQVSFETLYGIGTNCKSALELIHDERVKYIYIASNHASHTEYAIASLKANKTVYVEKPISVTTAQLKSLNQAIIKSSSNIYAGYNRPFAQAISDLKPFAVATELPMTYSCFVTGHVLDRSHWYFNPGEGTRICSNVVHWIDLAVHILSWGDLEDEWDILISYSNDIIRDENIVITMTSRRGDLISIIFSTRGEPFEGVAESVNIHQGDMIAKIDDFRKLKIWSGEMVKEYRYWPKDVGHNDALLQPFLSRKRDWSEILKSNILMLEIEEMVINGEKKRSFSFARALLDICS